MFSNLIKFDRLLFSLINNLPHNRFLDGFFGTLSGVGYLGAIWIIIGLILITWGENRNNRGFYALLMAGLITLLFNELAMKRYFRRLRPEFKLPEVHVMDNLTKSFSFPSGHATMSFAAALILSQTYPKHTYLYYILAFLISFSRIYLGKHYPIDVIVGGILGTVVGYLSLKIMG